MKTTNRTHRSNRTKKPVITEREASRLVAEAGADAYDKAGKAGGDPKAIKAMLDAEVLVDVGALKVRPLMLETFLVIEEMWGTQAHQGSQGSLRQALTLFTYCDPQQARKLFLRDEGAFVEACRAWAAKLPIADLHELTKLVGGHLNDFYQGGDVSKKKKVKTTGRKPSATGLSK